MHLRIRGHQHNIFAFPPMLINVVHVSNSTYASINVLSVQFVSI